MLSIILLSVFFSAAPCIARQSFVVNGTNADYADFPYQGSLQIVGSHACGCVFLAPNWVLTAGHCVAFPSSAMQVMFGSASLGRGNDTVDEGAVIVGVSNVTRHPEYDEGDGFTPNDIAVLRVMEPVESDLVTAISMAPDSTPPPDGSTCYISGWGRTCGLCVIPNDLQYAKTAIMDDIECENATGLGRDGVPNYQPENMICVYSGFNGACNGDSGGPLACEDENGDRLLYGVTSWGFLGCPVEAPSVYTRVGAFRSWVCEITGADADDGIEDCGTTSDYSALI